MFLPRKVSLDSGDIIHTGFLAFHTILDTSLPTAALPDVQGFPVAHSTTTAPPHCRLFSRRLALPEVVEDDDTGSQVPYLAVTI